MFFPGTLQEGILKAIQEKKRVVCFVRTDDDESKSWAEDYLKPLDEILQDHAVVLELQKDSTEAGYLGAICPVDSAPMVVVIYNGQVKGSLKPSMSVEEFRKQLLTAMDLNFRMSGPQTTGQPSQTSNVSQEQSAPTQTAVQIPTATSSPPLHPVVADAMIETRRHMADRAAAEERRRQAADAARQQAVQEPNPNEAYQAKLAEEKKKQRQAAADERKRVLDLIEADKQNRRSQAAQRAAERNAARQEAAESPDVVEEQLAQQLRPKASGADPGGKCRLQLRLWDGRTERAEFMTSQTVAQVKEWIEKNIEPNAGPYSLREVIGVGAARPLDVADEQETLASLGLTPSATLIVRPVVNAATRLDGSGSSSFLGPPVLLLYNFIAGILMSIWAALSGLLGSTNGNTGPADRTDSEAENPTARVTGVQGSKINIQTLDDRRKKKDKPTLYNGNQLGVIPNDNVDDSEE